MNRFIFTCGDINGIGPEIVFKALNKIASKRKQTQLILIIPENVFRSTSKFVKPTFSYKLTSDLKVEINSSSTVLVHAIKSFNQKLGEPTVSSGKASYLALKEAFRLIQFNLADAVITAPVSKTALNLAGVKFPGQTEMFADWCGQKNYIMTFLSKKIKVSLYSIHIPLKEVSKSLNLKEFSNKLEVLISMLESDLAVKNPRIAVLGLNPHAGENGIIGSEEKELLKPFLKKKRFDGKVDGPFSPDAFFAKRKFKDYDMVFGLYHDQVLIPFKFINAGKGVNFTAGLPIVRTSPDHGVAYDIAGKGIADESSILEAFRYAEIIIKNRKNSVVR